MTSCQLQATAGPGHPPGYQSTFPPSYESLHSQFPSAGTQSLRVVHASDYYKNNHRSEGIRVANARTKVIIFCKSRPFNYQLVDNKREHTEKSKQV